MNGAGRSGRGPTPARRAALLAAIAASVTATGCEEQQPVRPGICQQPAGSMITEVARFPDGVLSVAAAGDGVVVLERRGADFLNSMYAIRRLGRDGTGLDLGVLPRDDSDAELLASADELFWGSLERGAVIRRAEVKAMPLSGGAIRTLGVVRLDWSDDWNSLVLAAVPFAADDRAVYFSAYRQGAQQAEVRIYGMSRADGALNLLGRTRSEVRNAQLVGGHVWWTEPSADDRVFRVPTSGPPTVDSFAVGDCWSLRATAGGDFYCGNVGRLTHYDRDGGHPRVLIESSEPGASRPFIEPFALEADWLWLHEDGHGDVRKLHLPSGRLEDVACGEVKGRPLLTPTDVVWTERTSPATLDPASALKRVPR